MTRHSHKSITQDHPAIRKDDEEHSQDHRATSDNVDEQYTLAQESTATNANEDYGEHRASDTDNDNEDEVGDAMSDDEVIDYEARRQAQIRENQLTMAMFFGLSAPAKAMRAAPGSRASSVSSSHSYRPRQRNASMDPVIKRRRDKELAKRYISNFSTQKYFLAKNVDDFLSRWALAMSDESEATDGAQQEKQEDGPEKHISKRPRFTVDHIQVPRRSRRTTRSKEPTREIEADPDFTPRRRVIKSVKRRGTGLPSSPLHDPINGTSCHQCRQKTILPKVQCTSCPIMFDLRCLWNRYGETKQDAAKPNWLCLKCRGECNCSNCLRSENKLPTGQLASVAHEHGFTCVADYLNALKKDGLPIPNGGRGRNYRRPRARGGVKRRTQWRGMSNDLSEDEEESGEEDGDDATVDADEEATPTRSRPRRGAAVKAAERWIEQEMEE